MNNTLTFESINVRIFFPGLLPFSLPCTTVQRIIRWEGMTTLVYKGCITLIKSDSKDFYIVKNNLINEKSNSCFQHCY